jgi:hypothetical protein
MTKRKPRSDSTPVTAYVDAAQQPARSPYHALASRAGGSKGGTEGLETAHPRVRDALADHLALQLGEDGQRVELHPGHRTRVRVERTRRRRTA